MSRDNYVAIRKGADHLWRGYMAFASDELTDDQICSGRMLFEVGSQAEASLLACQENTEYSPAFLPAETEYCI